MSVVQFPTPKPVDPADLWPDPVALPSTLLPVPPFDEFLLPTDLRRWVVDIAERMNIPLDFVAIPAVIAASTLIGRKVGIRPERHTDWTEAGNLWGCIVGHPGALKSPAVREAFAALRRLESQAAQAYEEELEAWNHEKMVAELEKDEAKKLARAAIRGTEGDPFAGRLSAHEILQSVREPAEPRQIRFVTNDATPEKLGELCRDNPTGLLLHRDELHTMFTELDQEEKAAGRGFLMSGWGGLDGYTVDRIGRGTVRIPAVNISLFGTIQPARLTSYMRNALKHHDDGFVQRVQLLSWPDFGGEWVSKDRHRDENARDGAMRCYERLARLDADSVEAERNEFDGPDGIPFLRFAPIVQDDFVRWRTKLEAKVRDPDTAPALAAHLAKYRGLVPRLALVCHLANGGVGPVSGDAWVMAEQWGKYLEAHARRAYAAMETDNTATATAIVRRIKKGDLPTRFTSRDIYRKGWSGLKDRETVEAALKLLADYDWLEMDREMTGGRPSVFWNANPRIM